MTLKAPTGSIEWTAAVLLDAIATKLVDGSRETKASDLWHPETMHFAWRCARNRVTLAEHHNDACAATFWSGVAQLIAEANATTIYDYDSTAQNARQRIMGGF